MSTRRPFFSPLLFGLLLLCLFGCTTDPEGSIEKTIRPLAESTAYDHYRCGTGE